MVHQSNYIGVRKKSQTLFHWIPDYREEGKYSKKRSDTLRLLRMNDKLAPSDLAMSISQSFEHFFFG